MATEEKPSADGTDDVVSESEVARLLSDLRTQMNLTDTEIAGRVGVHRSTFYRWKNGTDTPRPGHARELAKLAKIKQKVMAEACSADRARPRRALVLLLVAAAAAGHSFAGTFSPDVDGQMHVAKVARR